MDQVTGKVLFVDDDEALLRMFSRMVVDQPWKVHFCSGVDQALQFLAENDIDTVVSDIRMPDKDGFDLLVAIRNSSRMRQVPVIMLTGDADRDLKRKALDLGATDLLNKPIGREDLFARIRSALKLKSYQDELEDQVALLDRRVAERTREVEMSNRDVIWRLAKAAEFRDDETGNHVVRVALYSRLLAEGLGMDREFLDLILLTSPLHDIGKLGIPDSILLKEGRLSPQERRLMEQHCVMGADILSEAPKAVFATDLIGPEGATLRPHESRFSNPLIETASEIAMGHHERWDGQGYPRNLAGEQISPACRIVSVADVFDALTSWRPYKPPLSEEDAIAIVARDRGTQFDPAVVEVFLRRTSDLLEVRRQLSRLGDNGTGPVR